MTDTTDTCTHLGSIEDVTPQSEGCAACIEAGDGWVHLRLCMTCGNVGCCDSSKNKHAGKHAHAEGHPVLRSFQPGETWMWCVIDEVYIDQ